MTLAGKMLSVSSVRGRSKRHTIAVMVAMFSLLITVLMPMQSVNAQGTMSSWSAPRTVYFADTGQSLDQFFLDLWRNAGGASAFGYPISSEITQPNGHIIQYLQYARFEYWPEGDADGNTVLLGKLGEELRPITLQRTTASFSSIGKTAPTNSSVDSLAEAKAWIPVPTDPAPDDKSFAFIPESQHTIRAPLLSFWYDTGGADFLGNPLTESYVKGGVAYQVFERAQLRYTEEDGVTMVAVGQILADKYKIDQRAVSQGDIPDYSEALFIPPGPAYGTVDPSQPLTVEVNLSSQYMIVYSGNTPVLESYVSTGRPGFDTPTGTFYVQSMYEYDDMEGVIGGEYYNVPQVPDVLYFTNQGHAIHGAYWHNNFGAVMSHGCINLPMDIAAWLYSYAYIGMAIVIYY